MVTMNPKLCKYGCETMMIEWDDSQRKFREANGQLHTQERCKMLKNQKGIATAANKAVGSAFTDKPILERIEKKLDQIIEDNMAMKRSFSQISNVVAKGSFHLGTGDPIEEEKRQQEEAYDSAKESGELDL